MNRCSWKMVLSWSGWNLQRKITVFHLYLFVFPLILCGVSLGINIVIYTHICLYIYTYTYIHIYMLSFYQYMIKFWTVLNRLRKNYQVSHCSLLFCKCSAKEMTFHPYWLAFLMLEVLYTLLGEKSNYQLYPVVNLVSYTNDFAGTIYHWCDNGTNITGVTNHFLIEFKSSYIG